jgi:Holliday junction resolvasome RuvABC DNA-binding subunit
MALEFKEFNIPLGWNALLNHKDKVALVLGENKSLKSSARTVLELLSKPTEAELLSAVQALGYQTKELQRPVPQAQ